MRSAPVSRKARGCQNLFAELRCRHSFKVAVAYGAVAFIALQLADIVFPGLALGGAAR
jgi:hypothetical protein